MEKTLAGDWVAGTAARMTATRTPGRKLGRFGEAGSLGPGRPRPPARALFSVAPYGGPGEGAARALAERRPLGLMQPGLFAAIRARGGSKRSKGGRGSRGP